MSLRTTLALTLALFAGGAHAAYPEKSIRIVVPYPPGGTTDILTRLVAQKLSESLKLAVLFDSVLSSGPQVKSGKLKVLATGNKQRLPSWPQVPALAESGLPGFEGFTWGALLAPAGTPPAIINLLQAEMARIFALPEVRQRVEELGALPGGGTAAELDAFSRAEMRKWAKVIKDGNIKAE